jgi:hypothetical protein
MRALAATCSVTPPTMTSSMIAASRVEFRWTVPGSAGLGLRDVALHGKEAVG